MTSFSKSRSIWSETRHDREQAFERFGKVPRIVEAGAGNFSEESFRQEAGVFGEEAKDDAVEEPGDAPILPLRDVHLRPRLRIAQLAALALLQRSGDARDLRGEFLGDLRGGALRLKKIRLAKEGAEQVNVFGFIDLAVRELVSFLDGAVEICLNDVAIKIADHEERRILEGLAITQELFVSRLEIFLFAFVFPGEAVLFPNIGETALFARFRIVLACFFLQKK
jgi:hypothetical protein